LEEGRLNNIYPISFHFGYFCFQSITTFHFNSNGVFLDFGEKEAKDRKIHRIGVKVQKFYPPPKQLPLNEIRISFDAIKLKLLKNLKPRRDTRSKSNSVLLCV
jgi:hypothetical protein